MKRYLVFVLLICIFCFQTKAENTCKVNHAFQKQTTIPITEVTYNVDFDLELVVNYNPLEQLTDKLRVVVQLPVANYIHGITAAINAPPKAISTQSVNVNTSQLIFEIIGFDKTQPSTFTVTLYNVNIAPVANCTPSLFTYSTSMQYYDANNSLVSFPGQYSFTIYGKHNIGSISTGGGTDYTPARDVNQPVYVEMSNYTSGNTYVGSNVLIHLNSNVPIKKVTSYLTNNVQTTTLNSKLYYIIPQNSSFRIYLDLPESSNTINLSLTGEAMFSGCTDGGIFPIDPVTYTFTGKPDDEILNYPSIFSYYNYVETELSYDPCESSDLLVSVFLDNIYNSPISAQQPIVITYDIPSSLKPKNFTSTINFPDKIFYRLCGNTTYEPTPITRTGNYFNFPINVNIDQLRLEFLEVSSVVSVLNLTVVPSAPINACTNNSSAVVCTLLKNNQSYIPQHFELISTDPGFTASLGTSYSSSILINDQEIRSDYLYMNIMKTLKKDDQFVYTLSENMSYADVPAIEMSLDNYTFYPIAEFNNMYFNSDPITCVMSSDKKKLTISNITIKGRVTCSPQFQLFFRVTSKVAHRPTSVSNVNKLSLMNKDGVEIATPAYYYWTVAVTQSVTNSVFFSCNDGTTKVAGVTIKKDDPFSVYYTLENTTLYKYDQKEFVFYCTLPTTPTTGVQPNLFLTKTITIGNIPIPSIITPDLYTVSYATGNLDDYATLVYGNSMIGTNILRVSIPVVTVNAYEKLILSLDYPANLNLTSNDAIRFYANVAGLVIPPQSSSLIIGPKSDCDLGNCEECITSFSPTAGDEYIITAWVKESYTADAPAGYTHSGIRITFNDGAINNFPLFRPTGPIVDGWQRIEASFVVPGGANNIHIALVNESANTNAFFDDIRIHPYNSNMKSFVYNPSNQKLVAELDENNFATLYEYDDEGILIRVKKETERGVMTIKETRSNQSKIR
jgi:hypothetical protein